MERVTREQIEREDRVRGNIEDARSEVRKHVRWLKNGLVLPDARDTSEKRAYRALDWLCDVAKGERDPAEEGWE